MQRGLVIVVSGPSGVGKNTVISQVFQLLPNLRYSISATTRAPRDQEVDGENYFFLSEAEFCRKIAENDFLEWAKVYQHYYGTLKSNVLQMVERGQDVILDVDVQGGTSIKKILPEAVLIFLAPPSLRELKNRLRGRHTEPEEEIERRLAYLTTEFSHIPDYDFFIINDQIDLTSKQIKCIILAEKCRIARQESGFLDSILNN